MTVKELIFTHKMSKILDACCERLPEHIDPKKWRKGLRAYLKGLSKAEPIYSKSIVLTRKISDFDGEEYWDACVIQEFDPQKLQTSYKNVQSFRLDMEKAYALFNTDHDTWNDMFYTPLQYAMEFTPAVEILGHQVSLRGIEEKDVYAAIAAIIDEMTFFGFEEETKQNKLEEIQETADEVDDLLKLPEEERQKHFCTLADLFPDMEITPLSEEEIEETRRNLVNQCFDNIEYLYDMLCNIKWRTCETLYIEE